MSACGTVYKHLAGSVNFKGSAFNNHRNGLICNRFETSNISYIHPLQNIKHPAKERINCIVKYARAKELILNEEMIIIKE